MTEPMIEGRWLKSAKSDTLSIPNCVGIAPTADGGLAVRDTKLGEESPKLFFNAEEIGAFFWAIREGWNPETGEFVSDGQVIGVFQVPDTATNNVLIPA